MNSFTDGLVFDAAFQLAHDFYFSHYVLDYDATRQESNFRRTHDTERHVQIGVEEFNQSNLRTVFPVVFPRCHKPHKVCTIKSRRGISQFSV